MVTDPSCKNISTHTPLAGRNGVEVYNYDERTKFLLTRPSRGATQVLGYIKERGKDFYSHAPRGAQPYPSQPAYPFEFISTHTPLAGRNTEHCKAYSHVFNFYSHAPRGAQPLSAPARARRKEFLLTRPSRGATTSSSVNGNFSFISTHTPLAGRNRWIIGRLRSLSISTHTPLAGRNTEVSRMDRKDVNFYSHAPRGAQRKRT